MDETCICIMSNEYSSREKSLKYLVINIEVNCMFQTYIQNTNTHASYINMYFVYSYIYYPFVRQQIEV